MRPMRGLLALACLALLALALPQSASARDRDRDGMSDRWERKHRAYRAGADLDRDRVSNLREFRAHTDPRDRDTDDDGESDRVECERHEDDETEGPESPGGEAPSGEALGTVASFDGSTLVIDLRSGGTLTGRVTGATVFVCERRLADGRRETWRCSADWLDPRSLVASARVEEGPDGNTYVEVHPLR